MADADFAPVKIGLEGGGGIDWNREVFDSTGGGGGGILVKPIKNYFLDSVSFSYLFNFASFC